MGSRDRRVMDCLAASIVDIRAVLAFFQESIVVLSSHAGRGGEKGSKTVL